MTKSRGSEAGKPHRSLKSGKHFFTNRIITVWNSLPIFKRKLTKIHLSANCVLMLLADYVSLSVSLLFLLL